MKLVEQKPIQWSSLIRRPGCPVLYYSFILAAYHSVRNQEIILLPFGITNHKYIEGFVLVDEGTGKEIETWFSQCLSTSYLNYFVAKCNKEATWLKATARKLRRKSGFVLERCESAHLFAEYCSRVINVMTFLTTTVMLERVLDQKICALLKNVAPNADQELLADALRFPRKKTLPSLAMKELLQISICMNSEPSLVELASKDPAKAAANVSKVLPELSLMLDQYLNRYDFINMEYFVGRPLTRSDALSMAAVLSASARERCAVMEADSRLSGRQFRAAACQIEGHEALAQLVKSLGEVHYARQYRSDALMKAGRDAFPFLENVGSALGLSYEELLSLTWQEIMDHLVHCNDPQLEIIEQRKAGYGIVLVDNHCKIVTGQELASELCAIGQDEIYRGRITGKSVSHGRYEGPVTIVLTQRDLDNVQSGDVIVSPMIDPYFLAAIAKAGAIVTDEGGILNHAAIISRELGIPSVVGTDIATKVLRNGMRVLIDATHDTGFVQRTDDK